MAVGRAPTFFEENPFALSPFETDLASGDNRIKDTFGFPTKPISEGDMGNKPPMKVSSNANRVATNAFFDLDVNGADSWGDPIAM